MSPAVIYRGALDMQVCVPAEWDDAKVLEFANAQNPAGTDRGWAIRQEGDKTLRGAAERVPCALNNAERLHVHIMLDA